MRRMLTMSVLAAASILPIGARASAFECFPYGGHPEGLPVPEAAGNLMKKSIMRVDKLGDSKWDNTDGHDLREVKTEGELDVLVILVNFQDSKFSVGGSDPRGMIDDMLNLPGFNKYGATGSAYDFYHETSVGQFSPRFHVYGPVEVSKNEVDYVKSSEKYFDEESGKEVSVYPAGRMVEEAVKLLDDKVDFSKFDTNNDGVVDFVYLFFAGKGATTGGNTNTTIWPHAYTLKAAIGAPVELDGVLINRYATSSELGRNNRLSGIGTFCHEFGHVLGLPDLYDTNNNGSKTDCFTPGTYDTMDAGNYNNDEHTPCHFSAYERYALEWIKPVEITGGGRFTVLPASARNLTYKVNTANKPQEYFMLEARHNNGWDAYLEGEGLIVWHIDFDQNIWAQNSPNNTPSHQRIDIIEADDSKDSSTRSGDVFPGTSGVCEFTQQIDPSFTDWAGKSTGYSLSFIEKHPDGSVSFEIEAENGKQMAGANFDSPVVSIKSVSSSGASLEWNGIEGANSYMISVYPLSASDGTRITNFVDGYYYRNVGNATTYEIEGLTPGESYGVTVYALIDNNASRSVLPVEFTAMDKDFAKASTRLYDSRNGEDTELRWDKVEGADSYLLTVARMSQGETAETVSTGFDNSQLPEGWSVNGRFETRASSCGSSAPSYKMESSCYIMTPVFERDIKSMTFWNKKRYSDGEGYMDVYSVDGNGNNRFLCRTADFSKSGENMTLEFPAGVKQVKLLFTMTTSGSDLFVDDLTVALCDGMKESPVSGYDALPVNGESCIVKGLDPEKEYSAYVVAVKGNEKGVRSQVLSFVPSSSPSGVEEIAGDDFADNFRIEGTMLMAPASETVFDVYALDGRCVAAKVKGCTPLPGKGVYVVKSNGRSRKIMW